MCYINKKQIALLAFFLGLLFPVFAQQKQGYNDVKPFSGASEFRKFSIGINAGVLNPSVIFGGSNDFAKPEYTLGYGANLRYQVNHYLGIQGDFLMGKLKGNQDNKYGVGRPISSFKTDLKWAGSLSGVVTFGNVNWLSNRNTVIPYASAGLGFLHYTTKIVAAGTTNEVDYVDNVSPKNPFFVPVGAGLKFNLSRVINLDLGYRMNFVDGDNLDGSPYWNNPERSSTVHKDKFSYGFVGLEFALGNKAKPQMLFDNPASRVNSYLQTQVDTVKSELSEMTKDSDNDGVVDKFDKEPNTPAGCPVDVHGVSLDTDGDGVPDCKDKELITPTQCQPVDADGIGKCPEPDCCKNIQAMLDSARTACDLGDLPSISFRGGRNALTSDAKAMLATVGSRLKSSANCSITITGYPVASKASQALCNRRTNAIKAYLVETEGIAAERIMVTCEVGGGDANTIDIKSNQ